jgi:hypothetical protein
MALHRSRTIVGFDASRVLAARVSWGLSGPRIDACALSPLAPGALIPSPFEANLRRPAEVRAALSELRQALGNPDRGVTLVLPSGVARVALFEAPSGTEPKAYARFRLSPGLPEGDTLADVLPLGQGRFLGAAVGRAIVAGYEQAAAAAGWKQERLDLAPLAALDGLQRHPPEGGSGVDVILGDAGFSLAAFREGGVRLFRSRIRQLDDTEAERLQQDVERTAAVAGVTVPRVRVVGPGAPTLVRQLAFRGLSARLGWELPTNGFPVEASELPWLGAAR